MSNIERKSSVVEEVKNLLNNTESIVLADYSGVSAYEMDIMRAMARNMNVVIKVIRNTLLNKALSSTVYSNVSGNTVGQLVSMFSMNKPSSVAVLINEFNKKFKDRLRLMSISIGNKRVSIDNLSYVASLPDKSGAIGLLFGSLNSILVHFVRTLRAPVDNMVNVIFNLSNTEKG